MRAISLIVVHCSATREDKSFTEHDLDVCHRRRGFNGVGYHFYIRKNGDIKSTRPLERIGAHARGFNSESIGICYEGGLDSEGHPKDTRTPWQKHSLRVLILTLLRDYPGCRVREGGVPVGGGGRKNNEFTFLKEIRNIPYLYLPPRPLGTPPSQKEGKPAV